MNCDELYKFKKIKGGYELTEYLQKENEEITRLDIPGQYQGEPVVRIGEWAFENSFYIEEIYFPPELKIIGAGAFMCCAEVGMVVFSEGLTKIGGKGFHTCENALRSVVFPKSLESIDHEAFEGCGELESVTFLNPETTLGTDVFYWCPHLPAEVQLMSMVRSQDITQPLPRLEYFISLDMLFHHIVVMTNSLFQEDVFALAVKNGCFREAESADLSGFFKTAVENDRQGLLRIAAEGGLLNEWLIGELIDYSVQFGITELTAWLLDHKKRKFGFNGGNDLELR